MLEMKADSHMMKHFLDQHGGEELEEIEFGGRIVRQARSAFNRQIGESVEIQANKSHYLLNSKSEYNRCALPRLSSKMGERTLDSIEKEKRIEKDKERELLQKIRELKVKRSLKRRESPKMMEQPAMKRRKIEENVYKRVRQEERSAPEKRKEDLRGKDEKKEMKKKTGIHPIFLTTKKRRKVEPEEGISEGEEKSTTEKDEEEG